MNEKASSAPHLRHIVNLWTLIDYPSAKEPWSLERQFEAIKEAGFDGITTNAGPEHARLAQQHELSVIGFISSSHADQFRDPLVKNRDAGASYVNFQLGDHDTTTQDAVSMAIELMKISRDLGLETSVEVHRDTCTETPEKTYALADGYQQATGELLPLTWDFSHLSVVKHLAPPFADRLLVRPDLVQRARQFHLRPFNGHHCQVPVTDGHGQLTPEIELWLPFAEDTFRMWRAGNADTAEIFAIPELGPLAGGYNLSTQPNSWEDAKVLKRLIAEAWERSANATT